MKTRSFVLFFVLLWVLIVTGGRLAYFALGENQTTAAVGHSLYTLNVDCPRGTIWDRNGQPLTNREQTYKTVLTATPQVISKIHEQIPSPQKEQLLHQLSSRKPLVITNAAPFMAQGATGIVCADRIPFFQPAIHLVGYLDSAGQTGLCGLQKCFDAQLTGVQSTTVTYACDATGGALSGVEPEIFSAVSPKSGVTTTLDIAVQQAAQEAFPPLKKGAIVVQKAGSGELLALVSAPNYSPQDIAGAMEHPQLPLLTRYCAAYNVGSVFKLCVAAAALEAGVLPARTYCCTGSLDCGIAFSCHEKEGHGTLTMEQAMAVSCNTYFMDLALEIGGPAVLSMAQTLGFDQALTLYDGMVSAKGSLPQQESLQQIPAEVCNFAIGQGSLMATPLQISAMTAAIAAGGIYFAPYCIAGITDRAGIVHPQRSTSGKRVFSSQTAQTLRGMMERVMTHGTGITGTVLTAPAAGKTATAQTGMLNQSQTPITQAWFTGFFPSQEPQYVITVLVEEGSSGSGDAAPVFRTLCQMLSENPS